jgi:hypothetical protein
MATMTKSRTRSPSKFDGSVYKSNKRARALPDSQPINPLLREAEPPEEAIQADEEPEFRQQCREEAPDAGIREIHLFESSFTHGRSRS